MQNQPTEKSVQASIRRLLKARGAWVMKTSPPPAGLPDLICCYKGKFFAIEVKRSDKAKVTELQKLTLHKIRMSQGFAFIAWNKEMVKDVLDLIDERSEGGCPPWDNPMDGGF